MIRMFAALALTSLGIALCAFSSHAAEPATPKRLSSDELMKMVAKLGYETKLLDKETIQVTVERDGGRSVMRVNLSNDGTMVWADAWFVTVSHPEAVPGTTGMKLLAKNNEINPAAFTMAKQNKRVYLTKPLPNVDVKPADLRKLVEDMDKLIQDNTDLWKLSNFVPPVAEEGLEQLASLEGKW